MIRGIVVSAAVLCAASFVTGASAEDFYAGKQMTIVVSSESGGGYDLYTRNVARWLPRHMPGSPTQIVQNMDGASGLRATNFLYNVAPKDGLTIGMVNNGAPFAPLYGMPQGQFDPTKFVWLGSPAKETSVFLIWHTVPVNSIDDAKKRELILGSASASTGGAFYARILTSVFGVKIKNITGYKGMTESLLAMERGENEGYASAFWSTLQSTKADWIRDKKIKFLLRYSGDPGQPGLEGVPLAEDLTANADDKLLLQIVATPFVLGRPMLAPPGVPADRAVVLKKALYDTFIDADFRADCDRQKLDCSSPSSGDETAALIARTYGAPAKVKKHLLDLYAGNQ